MPTAIHLYVPDADAVYQRALAAGATSLLEPMDEPYMGDRLASVEDLAGNQWLIVRWRLPIRETTSTCSSMGICL